MSSVSATAPMFQSLGRRSAYLEVAERIRATIFKDKLALFQRMPSERDLAAQFGVSRASRPPPGLPKTACGPTAARH